MNLSIPILIADEHDEIRLLQREMLTKHGFFHLLEASNREEVHQLLSEEQFLIIHRNLLDERLTQRLLQKKNFLVVCQPDDERTVTLAAHFGVKHLISFPYSSRSLMEKIREVSA